jgi:hypothetical protein
MAKGGTSRRARKQDPREALERSRQAREWRGDEDAQATTSSRASDSRGGGCGVPAVDSWPGPLDGSDVRALTTCDLNR